MQWIKWWQEYWRSKEVWGRTNEPIYKINFNIEVIAGVLSLAITWNFLKAISEYWYKILMIASINGNITNKTK